LSDIIVVEQLVQGNSGELEWQSNSIELKTEVDFMIDETNMEGELCKMGMLLMTYGKLNAELESQVGRKKTDLDRVSSQIELDIRGTAAAAGEKVTENLIRAKVRVDKSVQGALTELSFSQMNSFKLKNYFEALKRKCDCLVAFTYRQNTEMKRDIG